MKHARTTLASIALGISLWFIVGLQGSNVFGRTGEACVRFISLPLNMCSMTSDWLMFVDCAIWIGGCGLISVMWRSILKRNGSK